MPYTRLRPEDPPRTPLWSSALFQGFLVVPKGYTALSGTQDLELTLDGFLHFYVSPEIRNDYRRSECFTQQNHMATVQCGERNSLWNLEACGFEELGKKESLLDPKQISQSSSLSLRVLN